MSSTRSFRHGTMYAVIAVSVLGCADQPPDDRQVHGVAPAVVPQEPYRAAATSQALDGPPETWSRYSGEFGSLERFRDENPLESTKQIRQIIGMGPHEYSPIQDQNARLQEQAEALGNWNPDGQPRSTDR